MPDRITFHAADGARGPAPTLVAIDELHCWTDADWARAAELSKRLPRNGRVFMYSTAWPWWRRLWHRLRRWGSA